MKKVISMLLICVCLLTVCAVALVPANAANVVAEASAQKNMDDFVKFLKNNGTYNKKEYYVFKDETHLEKSTAVTPYYYYYLDGHILLYNVIEYPSTHVKVSITLPVKYSGSAIFDVDYADDAGETFTVHATVVMANYNGTNAAFKKEKGNSKEDASTLNTSANRMAKLAFITDDNTIYSKERNETGITGFGFPGMCRKHVYFPTVAPATLIANGAVKGTCHWCGKCITQKNVAKIALVSPSKTAFYYNGKAQTPVITVKDAKGNTLKYGTDYTLTYSSATRKAIGKYAVKVKFKGNYAGSALLYYTINPAKPAISSIAAGKKALVLKWKKAASVSGYQIQYSTNASFSGAKTVTVKGAATLAKTITGLQSGKTYYVRIRSYKATTFNKQSLYIYSGWNYAKAVKVK